MLGNYNHRGLLIYSSEATCSYNGCERR